MPKLKGILETSLYVSDLARTVAFYRDVLGLRLMDTFLNERGVAFQVGSDVLLLFRAEVTRRANDVVPQGTTGAGHIAFLIQPEELTEWKKSLAEHGVSIEKEISFGNNAPSIYFRDPDGNSLELAVATIWPFKDF